MHYFNGFCLFGEEELFESWLDSSDFTVAGFSYGAIEALEYALKTKSRVDRLILLSPAFFNNKDRKFKRLQLLYFNKDKNSYIDNFLNNISSGSNIYIKRYFKEGGKEELEKLLYYNWDIKKLQKLVSSGVTIEVVLGENDKIIDANRAREFFEDVAVVYYIKGANHLLKG